MVGQDRRCPDKDFRDRPMKRNRRCQMDDRQIRLASTVRSRRSMKLLYAEDEARDGEKLSWTSCTYHSYLVDAVSDGEDALLLCTQRNL